MRVLRTRFEANMARHEGLTWSHVEQRLLAAPTKLRSLGEMEQTGGEPDALGAPTATGAIRFVDCAAESPKGRRSVCYDREARVSRKENPPATSAVEMAHDIGIDLLSETEYRALQTVGVFDERTSSWIATPPAIRALGGALFCDRRYGAVFVYHNGAHSYYAARGFRGVLEV